MLYDFFLTIFLSYKLYLQGKMASCVALHTSNIKKYIIHVYILHREQKVMSCDQLKLIWGELSTTGEEDHNYLSGISYTSKQTAKTERK
jgi:hypothetical protein